jgi:hypothetical protein
MFTTCQQMKNSLWMLPNSKSRSGCLVGIHCGFAVHLLDRNAQRNGFAVDFGFD